MKRVAFVLAAWLVAAAPALAIPPALRGLAVDEALAGDPLLAPALDQARVAADDLPVFVRLIVRSADLGPQGTTFARLDQRLALYSARKIPVLLVLADPPTDPKSIDVWRTNLRALAEHCRGKVLGYQVGDRLEGAARPSPKDYAYLLKVVAVQVGSLDPTSVIAEGSLGVEGAAEWQQQLYSEDVAAYLTAVPLAAPADDQARGQLESALAALDALTTKDQPSALLGLTGLRLSDDGRQAANQMLGWHLAHLGGRSTFTTCAATVDAIVGVLKSAVTIKDVIGGEIVTLDEHEQGAALQLMVNGQNVTKTFPHRLLYNTTTFATYLVYWTPDAVGQTLQVKLHLTSPGAPAVRDWSAATAVKLSDVQRDDAAQTSTARVQASALPMVLDFNYGAEQVYAMRTESTERALPSVDEIIFRYQQAETAQAAIVHNYEAHARIDIHFQPTPLDSYDVVVENRFFSNDEVTEWEETSFSLNGTKFGRNRPPFPLLQPEKVLSLPLALRLNRDYAYRLLGTDKIGDRPCYVVAFDPIDPLRSLYRGKVWIDSEHYARLKVQAVQTGLTAPVVSNEEIQVYDPVATTGDRRVYLFSHLTSRQIMLIAGRNLLVEKNVTFSDFHVNDPSFDGDLKEAHGSDDLMYRDTDHGLRFLVKRGNERVVTDTVTTNGKALAAGVTFDPSYDYPVPLFGIDYLNFNFLNRGLQFGFVFSGVLAVGNVQKANIGGTKFDFSWDFLGIAVKSNDQVYDATGELKGERLQTRPASTGVNVGYQFTDFQKLTANVHVEYDQYVAASGDTAATFQLPTSTLTTSGGFNYEYRRGGYSLTGAYTYLSRARWDTWGDGSGYDPADRTYTKYELGLSKDFHLNAFNKIHLNAGYFGGQRLDRFSMYRSGLFDETRMRGVPSAGLRFSDLVMTRGSYSFNLFDLFRFAAYVDHAWGRTPSERTWAPTTGVGTEVNFRGPKMMMFKLGVGKGFLPLIYRGSGSLVVEFTVFKPI